MTHAFARLLTSIALSLCALLVFAGGSGLALAAPTTAPAPGYTAHLTMHLQRSTVQASTATPATVPPDCNSDPSSCAKAITDQFGGLYQLIILLIIWVAIAVGGIFLSADAVRGIIGLGSGEPRVLSAIILRILGVIILLVLAIEAPNILSMALHGAGQHIQPPPPPSFN